MNLTMERPGTVTAEWNHSCGPACGNCGNPNNVHRPVITPDVEPFPAPEPVTPTV